MIAVSRATDYAVRLLVHLASRPGRRWSIAEIANEKRLPAPYVRRIAARLAELGMVRSVRGQGGGLELALSAEEIDLFSVVSGLEGPTCPSPCVGDPGACPFGSTCRVRGVWAGAARALDDHLRQVRLCDLADDPPVRPSDSSPPLARRRRQPGSDSPTPRPERKRPWTP